MSQSLPPPLKGLNVMEFAGLAPGRQLPPMHFRAYIDTSQAPSQECFAQTSAPQSSESIAQ